MSNPIYLTPALYHAILSAGQRGVENIDNQPTVRKKRRSEAHDARPNKYQVVESRIRGAELTGIDISAMKIDVKSFNDFSWNELDSLACAFDRLDR